MELCVVHYRRVMIASFCFHWSVGFQRSLSASRIDCTTGTGTSGIGTTAIYFDCVVRMQLIQHNNRSSDNY